MTEHTGEVRWHHITVMQKSTGVAALAGAGQEALAARGGRATPALNNILGTGAEVLARGLDKDAEYEADHLGVVLATRAGYSPYGLVEVLHKLQARGTNDASLALLFTTHPAAGDRLGKLGEVMTPRIAKLPAGQEPRIQAVSADVPPAPARTAAEGVPTGARCKARVPARANPAVPREGALASIPAASSEGWGAEQKAGVPQTNGAGMPPLRDVPSSWPRMHEEATILR